MAAKKSSGSPKTRKAAAKAPTPSAAKKPAEKKAKASGGESAGFLAVGQSAPVFTLADDQGKKVSLTDFKGKTVVLYFYPKDQTPGCTQQACDFRDNLARLTAKGAVVLGVSADSADSHRRFKEKQSLNFPLLADVDKKVLNAYGVWQEKSLYGRKFMGIVRTTYVIDGKGLIRAVFPKVKVASHVDAVMAAL